MNMTNSYDVQLECYLDPTEPSNACASLPTNRSVALMSWKKETLSRRVDAIWWTEISLVWALNSTARPPLKINQPSVSVISSKHQKLQQTKARNMSSKSPNSALDQELLTIFGGMSIDGVHNAQHDDMDFSWPNPPLSPSPTVSPLSSPPTSPLPSPPTSLSSTPSTSPTMLLLGISGAFNRPSGAPDPIRVKSEQVPGKPKKLQPSLSCLQKRRSQLPLLERQKLNATIVNLTSMDYLYSKRTGMNQRGISTATVRIIIRDQPPQHWMNDTCSVWRTISALEPVNYGTTSKLHIISSQQFWLIIQ